MLGVLRAPFGTVETVRARVKKAPMLKALESSVLSPNWVILLFLSSAFSACPPAARPSVVVSRCGIDVERRVFCPCVLRNKLLDDHVRKPPGVEARGDVVSVEPLQNVETPFFLVLWIF